ncbi:MAG: hydroxysqualene dehydroxylase HpnE [Rhodospirillales bacterium]
MPGRVHVIGAGLSGLSAAVRLASAGWPVRVYEAAGHAGGRCRSFFDAALGRRIDNGNHLVLSGNENTRAYLEAIGAGARLRGPERAEFPFVDLETGARWTVRPGAGPLPWWILSPSRRVPGSRPWEYLRVLRLAFARREATVAECLDGGGTLFRRFWEPLAVAALNASAAEAAAVLLWPVVRETFGRGEAACRPRIADPGLSECFVDPALSMLAAAGAEVRFGCRLRAIVFDDGGLAALAFAGGETVTLAGGDRVVLAVPPGVAAALLPGVETPRDSRAIVNGHFLLAGDRRCPPILGVIGGLCQWVFVRGDVASVTVSAADALADEEGEAIATRMWRDVIGALDLGAAPLPPYRIVKEKRATFAQTPSAMGHRPGVRTRWSNLLLAGDWTDTGLPATIEGSVRSGHKAAMSILENATTS